MQFQLQKGASDYLNLAGEASGDDGPVAELVRSYIASHGDHVVHFSSGDVKERATTNSLSRWIVLTEHSIFCIPISALETGIFFETRISLDLLTQVVAEDPRDSEPEAHLLQRSALTNDSVLMKTFLFPTVALRKAFLLSLCVVHPSIPILQRRLLPTVEPDSVQRDGSTQNQGIQNREGNGSNQRNFSNKMVAPSPTTASRHLFSASRQRSNTRDGGQDVTSAANAASPPPKAPSAVPVSPEPIFDIADDVFHASRDRLRSILSDTWGETAYDAEKVSQRPPEEDPSRADERAKIRADLEHRERKIIQNIEFRLKYPTKPATRVLPGVEYDKAHEERLTLPDDLGEDELLGPALYSFWREWKLSNGLLGTARGKSSSPTNGDSPNGATNIPEWNLYASNELISALREKENELFGFVGPRSLQKVRTMRELVSRERLMFLNSTRRGASASIPRSPNRVATAVVTKPKPFMLSESPFSSLKAHVKLLEKIQVVSSMKATYDDHLRSRHELHKSHLQRQLH